MTQRLSGSDDAARARFTALAQTGDRPRLLVSVRNAAEAAQGIAGGADWIDFKEPRAGPLGAVAPAEVRHAERVIPRETPLSAACGELLAWPQSAARRLLEAPRIAYLKLGLAGCQKHADWRALWRRARGEALAAGKDLALVAYADADQGIAPPWPDIVEFALQQRYVFLLFDTFAKPDVGAPHSRTLLDWIAPHMLADALRTAKQGGVGTAVAGSLDIGMLGALPWSWIDVLAVRGAACVGGREGEIDAQRVADLRQALDSFAGKRLLV